MNKCPKCGSDSVELGKCFDCGHEAALPPVRSEPLLALPEDVRSFIERVTLHLQANRSKTPEQHDAMFQTAYRLYGKYDVEGRSANTPVRRSETAPGETP